jgi:hypothetical protein
MKKVTTFSGGHGQQQRDGRGHVAGKLSKTLKDVRERFFAKKSSSLEKEKLTPIQRRQNSGGV